ncbi:class I SAM-dependent methyltransferase [Desulfoscipio geothermicus]|uniref:Methyltransferase domain-containing protein n=1 Tax=Desulfoscipio geothermicus DSM 3669 TaxID=1121426 RepID=A0A1I6D8N2_9FIRM|nr:class I SAM-dependent methyltransferase [Desulfoscipio geothermicus]SFR01758.1 hypothetical protein SAMN05660706_10754 [Desulfoscipio geothermicus DSM 3669]
MSLELFGYKSVREKIDREKQWMKNNFADCPVQYHPEAAWRDNAVICRLSLLKQYCDTFGIYQILNKEFNDALAWEIKQLALSPVLEVGAGRGDLAAALRARGIEVTAVDNYSEFSAGAGGSNDCRPLNMDFREALEQYQPRLVLCSWMPEGQDWTRDFREAESVKAYILIGEEEKNIWFEFTGWRSRILKGPNKWSLCRLDHGVDFDKPELWWRHSKIILYERIE